MLARVFVSAICCVWGLAPKGLPEVDWVGLWGPRTLQGPHTNEACSSLMEQIQEKQTCDVVPSGGPESLAEWNRTLVEFVCCVRVRERGERGGNNKYVIYIFHCWLKVKVVHQTAFVWATEWIPPATEWRHFCPGSDDFRIDFLLVLVNTQRASCPGSCPPLQCEKPGFTSD